MSPLPGIIVCLFFPLTPVKGGDEPALAIAADPTTPEETPEYLRLAARAERNARRYARSFVLDRFAVEEAILEGRVTRWAREDYVTQNRTLGDQALTIQTYHKLRAKGPEAETDRKELYELCRQDLMEAKQYRTVLRVAGDVLGEVDGKIAEYEELKARVGDFEGMCGNAYPFHLQHRILDYGTYFEALIGLGKREEAARLAALLISHSAMDNDEQATAHRAALGFRSDFAGKKDAAFWTALVKGAIAARQADVARYLLHAAGHALPTEQIETLEREIREIRAADDDVDEKPGPVGPFPARDGRLAEEPSPPPP